MRDYTNYHNTNYTDKLLRDGIKVFERSLTTSPDSSTVTVNSTQKNIMIQSTSNFNERRILFKHGDVNWGDIVLHEDEKWLVTERPYFNKIHDKSKMNLCNANMRFTKEVEGIIEGYDPLGNPIYSQEPSTEIVEFPCVIESISDLNTKTNTGQQINVPEGDMVVQISYTTDELIHITSEFEMYDDTYRISGIDKSKTDGTMGVLILVASRAT